MYESGGISYPLPENLTEQQEEDGNISEDNQNIIEIKDNKNAVPIEVKQDQLLADGCAFEDIYPERL